MSHPDLQIPAEQAVSTASEFLGKQLGQALNRIIMPQLIDDKAFVLLTPELADHLADMYQTTDWQAFSNVELKYIDMQELAPNRIKRHIGEIIFVSLGDAGKKILSAKYFVPGESVGFWKTTTETVGEEIDMLLRDSDLAWHLLLSALLCEMNDIDPRKAERAFLRRIPIC